MKTIKVLVAVSGGVDSGTVAWLLSQDPSFDTTAVFMKNWHDDSNHCTFEADKKDAQAVADHCNIPLIIKDFSKEYHSSVFQQMLASLESGLTPNPDIFCNEAIKFGCLLTWALEQGYQRLVTGHYASIQTIDNQPTLCRGIDPIKDQSYFLARMPTQALAHVDFPLGNMSKQQVRELAQQAGLPVAHKKDSTGICFVGKRKFADFIGEYLLDQPGPLLSEEGQKLGMHRGLFYYTIGQRKGIDIGGLKNHAEAPWYVLDKRLADRAIIVTQNRDHPGLLAKHISIHDCLWFNQPPRLGQTYHSRLRHGQKLQSCQITSLDTNTGHATITFDQAQRAAVPGQYFVVYDASSMVCLGGGIIQSTLKKS